MADFTRIFIPLFFILFFLTEFLGMSAIVARKTGKNPNVFSKDDSAYSLIGKYFKLTLLFLFLYTVLFFLFPEIIYESFKINILDLFFFKLTGILLMLTGWIWVLIAQYYMKNSWRIGIDKSSPTALVTIGLFKYSRNPVFLGMMMSLTGLLFSLPNFISLVFLLVGTLLMQIQIRLEEEFLLKQHGSVYSDYKKRVRRFI
ncbi:isoprenylcysteine carboxylmethyltransferase family protein [uncultured Chryseobacterium sp.]|uniref:methyltransferase family protein n=1 Tax=uncultured Chryseobacterium sp. TaxID=259322 RepID=UPI0025D229B9|nr:isoprenylcysteine carboxylmethyltransferase family protein [uncultured Chryseobacterium sp.]